ncbi:MAG TPA: tripartite tricarboxylate transporter substrate-binding protein [Candidatus Binatia bacterium]|nr:tripartite tricarboxylate transporter substrate-binding protein [Candidatus Binatia bacterium]
MIARKTSSNIAPAAACMILSMLAVFFAQSTSAQNARPFYEGKTIQIVVASGPGASTDIGARLVGRFLGKHVPGYPSVIVQNMPGAGGLVAANYIYNLAKPDGLTLVAVTRSNYLDQMVSKPEVKFDFRKFGWIGSFNKSPMMVACRSDTPYKSIAAMRSAKTPPRFGQAGTGSISYVFANLMSKALDVRIKNVLGFGSGREIDLGMERGEADCRATSDITVIRPPWDRWMKENFVTFVLQQGPQKSRLLPPVPTVAELAAPQAKPFVSLMDVMLAYTEFDRPYAAPPGLPAERLQTLRESFEKMLRDPDFVAEAKKLLDWDGTTYLSGQDLQKKIEVTVTQPPEIIQRIKEVLEET